MKPYHAAIALALAAASISSNAHSQSTAIAGISATIVTPNTIEKQSDIRLILPLVPKNTRTGHGESTAGTITPASFIISGDPAYTYGITVPALLAVSVETRVVAISTEKCSVSANQTLSTQGTDMLFVEGTIIRAIPKDKQEATRIDSYPVTLVYN